jgi:hypothetical protein
MATLPVPRYLAQTAARDPAVGEWLGCLPQIVTGLASQWLLRVGALAVKPVWSREWQRCKAGTRTC